jgi:hypothetical protein
MTEWRFVSFGPENDELELGGLPVWREAWRELPESVTLSDPSVPGLTQRLGVYEIGPVDSPVRFAAGEFSDGIWGFFIPAHDWRYRVVDVIPGEGLGKIILLAGATDLPTSAEVTVRLKTPDGAVVEMTGLKAWELPIDGPPYQQDAFLLPDVEWDIPKGALAEVAEPGRATSHEAPSAGEEEPSLSSSGPPLVEDALSPPSVERDIPEGALADVADLKRKNVPEASAAGELRTPFSSRERVHAAGIGNAAMGSFAFETLLEADHGSPEADLGTEALLPIGGKTILVFWIVYAISAIYVIFRVSRMVFEIMMVFHSSNFFGESQRTYEDGLLIWLGASIFYLAIGPVAILKLDRLRRVRVKSVKTTGRP